MTDVMYCRPISVLFAAPLDLITPAVAPACQCGSDSRCVVEAEHQQMVLVENNFVFNSLSKLLFYYFVPAKDLQCSTRQIYTIIYSLEGDRLLRLRA